MRNSKKLSGQFAQIFRTPAILIPGVMDAGAAWLDTRFWIRIVPTFLVVLFFALPFLASTLRYFHRKDALAMRFLEQAERRVSPTILYNLAVDQRLKKISEKNGWDAQAVEQRIAATTNQRKFFSDVEYSRICAEHAIGLQPQNASAIYRLGLIYELKSMPAKSEKYLDILGPRDRVVRPAVHTLQALRLMEQDESDLDALLHHVRAIQAWPDLDYRVAQIASLYFEKRKLFAMALDLAKIAANKVPQEALRVAVLAKANGQDDDFRKAAESVVRQLSAKPSNTQSPAEFYSMAWCLTELGRKSDAIRVLRDGITKENFDARLPRMLGDLLVELYRDRHPVLISSSEGISERDFALLEEASQVDPENPKLGELIAEIMATGGNVPPRSKSVLKSQLDRGMASPNAILSIAKAYFAKGKFKECAVQAEACLAKSPQNDIALELLARSLIRLQPPEPEKAKELIAGAMKQCGRAARWLDLYGDVASSSGEAMEAIEAWEEALSFDRANTSIRTKLIHAYQASGRPADARKHEQVLTEVGAKRPSAVKSVASPP